MNSIKMTAVTLFLASSVAWGERFDRTAVLPEIAKAARTAATALGEFKKANRDADLASRDLAQGFRHLAKDKRDEATAQTLVKLETSQNTMLAKLEVFYGMMVGIQNQIEGGLSQGLGEVRGQLDGLIGEFTEQIGEKTRSSSVLSRLAEISDDAMGEKEAQKLNGILDEVDRRQKVLEKLKKRRQRIASIHETVEQKIESIKAVTGAVEARMAELRSEAILVKVLKKEVYVNLVTKEVFGVGKSGDPVAIFDSNSSKAIDEMLGREERRPGVSQREFLKARLRAKPSGKTDEGGISND